LTLTAKKRTLSRAVTLEFLDGLAGVRNEEALTLYLPPGLTINERQGLIKEISAHPDIAPDLDKVITGSQTGAIVFWSPEIKCSVLPPFPILNSRVNHKIDSSEFYKSLRKDHIIALLLVRLGSYGIGVYQGEKLLVSKVGTGLVHGRHRQGGSSAHRFERHRDKQIESFLTRVCRHAREQIEPYVKSMDYIVFGGARTTILLLQKRCPLLRSLITTALPPLLDIPDPRQAVLETAITRVWSSTLYEWRED
jgi:hypothetical protein